MSDKPEVITSEVEASEQTVEAVRADMPVGVAPKPLDRVRLDPGLAAMANSGVTTKRLAGTERCIRVVQLPLQGGGTDQAHCFRACVRVGDMQLCPEHDKGAFQPSQSPVAKGRTINSASIGLSAGETAELSKISKSFAVPHVTLPSAAQTGIAVPAVSEKRADMDKQAGYAEPAHDLKIYLRLDELAGRDLLAVLKERICEALDGLPCRTVREMKQIVALQAKVAKLSKGGKKHVRENEDSDAG